MLFPFHFQHRGARRLDVEQDIVPFAVFLDPVGKVPKTPLFLLFDLSAALGDDRGHGLGYRFHLGG